MQKVFKNALYCPRPVVLKRQLLPLSCGHVYFLMAYESPFVFTEKPVTIEDLVLAVRVCSVTWEENQEYIDTADMEKDFQKWRLKCGKADYLKEADKLWTYWRDYTVGPERIPTENSSTCLHPWPLVIAVSIMDKVGESRAWNMPLPMARAVNSVLGELAGERTLMDDEQVGIRAGVREFNRKLKLQESA